MRRPGCDFWPEIARTVAPESDVRLRAHLESCRDCHGELQQIARAVAALRSVSYQPPSADAREQARTRLMASIDPVAPGRPMVRRLWTRAVVVAASLCAATVAAAVGAKVFETLRPATPAPAVSDDARLVRPHRTRGRVASVEPPAPAPVPEAPPTPPVAIVAPRPRSSAAPRAPVTRAPAVREEPAAIAEPAPPVIRASPQEIAFKQGWEVLRAGDHLAAAAQLQGALELDPGSALAEDARYWRAVALGRAAATRDARAAMEEFLRWHPRSPRASEISVMLAWVLVDTGEAARAQELFRAGARDPSPAVRQSAQAGLELAGATAR